MRDIIAQEKSEEQNSLYIHIKNPKKSAYVITRSGRGTASGGDLPAADPPVATRTRSRHPSPCKRDSEEILPSENLQYQSGGQNSGDFAHETDSPTFSHDLPTSSTPISPRRVHFDPDLPPDSIPGAPRVSVESWGGVGGEVGGGGRWTSQKTHW